MVRATAIAPPPPQAGINLLAFTDRRPSASAVSLRHPHTQAAERLVGSAFPARNTSLPSSMAPLDGAWSTAGSLTPASCCYHQSGPRRAGASAFAAGLGPLLACFTGEHVGEPRLLIALYGPPPVHVDLKFVPVLGLGPRRGHQTRARRTLRMPRHVRRHADDGVRTAHRARPRASTTSLRSRRCCQPLAIGSYQRRDPVSPRTGRTRFTGHSFRAGLRTRGRRMRRSGRQRR